MRYLKLSMQIDVIIPSYNRAHCLLRAVDSVLGQTYQDFNLLVIDDGSTDNTFELLKPYIDDKKLTYLKTENRGVSAARNFGVQNSISKWIAFLDSDDEWLPHKLTAQVEFIQQNPQIPLVHGEETWIRKGKRVNPKNIHKKFGGRIFERCLPLCLISPSATILKRELLTEVGGFDEDYVVCEDYDLWLKITSLYEVGFIEEPIITKYGGHDDQLSAKYFAMDFWRIKALDRILKIRKLTPEQIQLAKAEIIRKGQLLLAGYQKHGNMSDFPEVQRIVDRCA
jgi:glycosyltransferase involved in cell wall biosynthesis